MSIFIRVMLKPSRERNERAATMLNELSARTRPYIYQTMQKTSATKARVRERPECLSGSPNQKHQKKETRTRMNARASVLVVVHCLLWLLVVGREKLVQKERRTKREERARNMSASATWFGSLSIHCPYFGCFIVWFVWPSMVVWPGLVIVWSVWSVWSY